MFTFLKRRQLHSWLACLAMLFNAFAPTLSVAANGPRMYTEMCTVSGTKYVAVGQDETAGSATDSVLHHLKHCPFCMTHAGSFALPPAQLPPFAALGGHDVFPPLFYQAPAPLFSWTAAKPRGPPATA